MPPRSLSALLPRQIVPYPSNTMRKTNEQAKNWDPAGEQGDALFPPRTNSNRLPGLRREKHAPLPRKDRAPTLLLQPPLLPAEPPSRDALPQRDQLGSQGPTLILRMPAHKQDPFRSPS